MISYIILSEEYQSMQTLNVYYYKCKDKVSRFLFRCYNIDYTLDEEVKMSRIVINKDKCKACYLCINECPKKLLRVGEETNSLGVHTVEFHDPNHECLGCAMCAMRCPDLAITEVYKD